MEIKLNEQDLKTLDSFFQEMPTKYGSQLISFFNQKIQEQATKEESLDRPEPLQDPA